jgi:hypothetical protein
VTIWYAIGTFTGMLGGVFYELGRSGEPGRYDNIFGLTCNGTGSAVFTCLLAFEYWLRIRRSNYARADAHFFALGIGVVTPYVLMASFAFVGFLGGDQAGFVIAMCLWLFGWPFLAGELSVRYCRWRKLPPDSPAT